MHRFYLLLVTLLLSQENSYKISELVYMVFFCDGGSEGKISPLVRLVRYAYGHESLVRSERGQVSLI